MFASLTGRSGHGPAPYGPGRPPIRGASNACLSGAADFEVTQVVNEVKGVHCLIAERDFHVDTSGRGASGPEAGTVPRMRSQPADTSVRTVRPTPAQVGPGPKLS